MWLLMRDMLSLFPLLSYNQTDKHHLSYKSHSTCIITILNFNIMFICNVDKTNAAFMKFDLHFSIFQVCILMIKYLIYYYTYEIKKLTNLTKLSL